MTVIVPVWNDAGGLSQCLRALEGQTYPEHLYEVLVVDNDSEEPVAPIVARHGRAELLREVSPGSYAARNAGLAQARGEVVAFTDADCLPAPDWIEKGVGRLTRGGGRLVVAGKVEVYAPAARPNAVEQFEVLFALAQREFVGRYRFGATANLFAYREAFARVGPFLAEVKSGGDLEWGRRAAGRGYRLEYAEETRVRHPARDSLSQLYSKSVRVAGGLHDLRRIKGRAYLEFDRGLLWELLPPVRTVARTLREPRLSRRRDRVKVCAVLLFVRYVQAFERLRLALPKLWSRHTTAR
ncbi:MAG: glycosyltransferase [Acidobacteria bacterium]|nr:glycosyltransferase [Acidobacteriota bacterium]